MRTAPDNFPKLSVNTRVRFKPEASPEVEPVGTIFEVGYCSVKIQWTTSTPSRSCAEYAW